MPYSIILLLLIHSHSSNNFIPWNQSPICSATFFTYRKTKQIQTRQGLLCSFDDIMQNSKLEKLISPVIMSLTHFDYTHVNIELIWGGNPADFSTRTKAGRGSAAGKRKTREQ